MPITVAKTKMRWRMELASGGISGEFNERSFVSHYPCDTAGRALIGFLAAARGADAAGTRGAGGGRRSTPPPTLQRVRPSAHLQHRVRYEDMIVSPGAVCAHTTAHEKQRLEFIVAHAACGIQLLPFLGICLFLVSHK